MPNSLLLFPWRLRAGHRAGALLVGLAGLASPAFAQVSFAPATAYASGGTGPSSIAVRDLNADNRPDLVVVNGSSGTIGVLLATSTGTFPATATTYASGTRSSGTTGAVLGDLNGDGRLDIVVANPYDDNVGVLLSTGAGTFPAAATTYPTGSNPAGVALADVNSDGRLDIITANTYGTSVGVLLGRSTGGFAASVSYGTGSNDPQRVAAGDVNRDGRPDLVVGTRNNQVGVFLNNGTGGFPANPTFYSAGPSDIIDDLELGDVNNDGRLDVVLANSATSRLAVLLGTATNGFATAVAYSPGTNSAPNAVALGDLNRDGQLDVVNANYNLNSVGVLLNQGSGSFPAATTRSSTGNNSAPNDVAVADVNNDTKPDLITANFTTGTVSVLLNTTVLAVATAKTAATAVLYPNPARTSAMLTGAMPGAAVQVRDMLGRLVLTATADATGTATLALPTGLSAGVYLVRSGPAPALRLTVE